MKLKYIFTAFVAALTLAVGCEDNLERHLDEVQVSSSYVAIPANGGSQTITVTATDSWSFDGIPDWLTVSPTSGAAGESEVTFKADAATSTNEVSIYLNCAGKQQIINVLQQTEKVELETISLSEFLAKEVGPTVYRIAGTISNIQEISASYKNATLTISDDEGYSVYLYRFGPPAGKKIEDLGMEVGDFLTVEGQRGEYGGSPQMAQGGIFVSLVKSLIKVDSVDPETAELPIEGGQFTVNLTAKGDGISVEVPEDAKEWLSVASVSVSGGAGVVVFNVAANPKGDRSTTITFNTVSDGKSYSAQTSLFQKGAIIEATAAEINAAADGDTQYRLTGYISKDKGSEYGNIYVKDATGEVYVYGVLNSEGQSKQWNNMGISEGDIVTVVGPKTSYKGDPQLKNVTVEDHKAVKDITAAEFVAKDDDNTVYYRLKGTVSGIKDGDVYGNFDLTDESGAVYVYGLLEGWGGAKKQFQNLGIKDGDIITIVACVGSYKGKKQAVNAFFVAKEESTPVVGNIYDIKLKYELGTNAYDDKGATINGTDVAKVVKIGTGKAAGSVTVTVPAGSKNVSFYAVAWNNAPTTLTFSMGGQIVMTQEIAANAGAAGNENYNITVADSDKYSFNIPIDLATDTPITISTAEGAAYRAIFFGINAE